MKALVSCGRNWAVVVAVVGLMAVGAGAAQAGTVFVSTAGNDASDGLSWGTAKLTVQAGLNAAGSGDQVWVAAGTYVQCITLKTGVGLYGGFVGTETDLSQRNWVGNVTILDGNQAGSVVTGPAGAATDTRIDGFTIRNGKGTVVSTSDSHGWYGGGIYCKSSSPTIANNTITGNSVSSCGGGIYCSLSSPAIANNTIASNSASSSGGGIYCSSSSPTIRGNKITGCISGGIACVTSSSPFIAYNTISANIFDGIDCSSSSPAIVSNFITDNGGVGINCNASSPTITNCTITGNTSGGGIYAVSSSPVVANTIVAFNSPGIYKAGSGTMSLRYNCVYGNVGYNYSGQPDPTGSNGNLSVDPRLANVSYGNSHIQPDSPCVDAGDDTVVQAGWTDVDGQARIAGSHVDIGADESDGTVWPSGPALIVRVSTAGDDANDGSSWGQAKRTVQAGVDAAAVLGGEVWVQAGTYVERITLREHVFVYGGFTGTETQRSSRDWSAYVTILDGNHGGSVVTIRDLPGYATSAIDGFVIRNGTGTSGPSGFIDGGGIFCICSSLVIANDTITGNSVSSYGGGIYCAFSYPVILSSSISGNSAGTVHSTGGYGGGIYWETCYGTISGNTITDNSVNGGSGGGIYCDAGSSTIANNTISRNSVNGYEGSGGGGICLSSSSATISGNTISSNSVSSPGSSPLTGGGISCGGSGSSSAISNNTISGNVITGGAYAQGGGIYYNESTTVVVASCTIVGNSLAGTSKSWGGGIYAFNLSVVNCNIQGNSAGAKSGTGGGFSGGNLSMINSTIQGNIASFGGAIDSESAATVTNCTIAGNSGKGAINCSAGPMTIANTIVSFNSSGICKAGSTTPTLRYNCVYGNTAYNYSGVTDPTGTNGNISADPLFVAASPGPDGIWGTADDTFGDLHLLPGSPGIDAGNNADVPADTADLNGNGDTTEPLPFDLAGASRFADDPNTPDTGAGTAPIVDIGAYEYHCGDANGDGHVDVVDLLDVVYSFGTVKGDAGFDPTCDFNHDGAVDVVDLLDLVYNFGT